VATAAADYLTHVSISVLDMRIDPNDCISFTPQAVNIIIEESLCMHVTVTFRTTKQIDPIIGLRVWS